MIAQPLQQVVYRQLRNSDGGSEQTQRRGLERNLEEGWVLAAQVGQCRAGAQGAVALGDVPDMELQRLRHLPVGCEKGVDFLPSHSAIKAAAKGSVRDAVDTGQAGGFKVRDGFEPLVCFWIERSGNQYGHICLN